MSNVEGNAKKYKCKQETTNPPSETFVGREGIESRETRDGRRRECRMQMQTMNKEFSISNKELERWLEIEKGINTTRNQ
jgi:hypothetical protein